MSEQEQAGRPKYLTGRYVRAGTDPDSGAVVLSLDVGTMGFDAPDQRYKLDPRAARKVGAQLLLASDPEMAAALIVGKRRGLGQVLAREAYRTTEPDDAPRQRFATMEEMARVLSGEAVLDAKPARSLDPQLIDEINRGLHQGNIDPEAYKYAKAAGTIRELQPSDPTPAEIIATQAAEIEHLRNTLQEARMVIDALRATGAA